MERQASSPPGDHIGAVQLRRRRGDSARAGDQTADCRPRGPDPRGGDPGRLPDPVAAQVNKTYFPVVDDLPEDIPVLGRELDAIDIYLGTLIDELVKPGDDLRDATLCPDSEPTLAAGVGFAKMNSGKGGPSHGPTRSDTSFPI